jgi:hypothetical protein
MAYIEGHGYSGGGDGFDDQPDEPSVDHNRNIAVAVSLAALVILIASVVSSNMRDTTPWTSGSVTMGLSFAAIALAALFSYRSIRRAGGSFADGQLGVLTVTLATPLVAMLGYVVLAAVGVEQ